MQPYEIRQFRDGRIDYDSYCARPISLLTPNMYRFCRASSFLKTMLIVAATVAVLVFAASNSTHRTACAQCTPMNPSATIIF